MSVLLADSRYGDFATLKSPTFNISQTGCLQIRFNLSKADSLDLFFLEGERSLYRQHVCTIPGIDHTEYEGGIDPFA